MSVLHESKFLRKICVVVVSVFLLSAGSSSLLKDVDATTVFSKQLQGRVACVTGASRGIGRGIAIALAEQGAKVYITGRSVSKASTTDTELGGNLQDLVDTINAKGGQAIPIAVDHRNDANVQSLFQQIGQESGRLDILVNNAFQLPTETDALFQKFWEQPISCWDSITNVGLRSHFVASHYAYPLMKQTQSNQERSPLIVHISSFGGAVYCFNVAYGVGKAGVDRLARDMHVELKNEGIKVVSLYPGIVRTERMATLLDSGEYERRTNFAVPKSFVESPELSGEVIAALYCNTDGYLEKQSGKVCVTAELAKRYQLRDRKSGIIPPSIRSLKFLIPSLLFRNQAQIVRDKLEQAVINVSPDILLPFAVLASGSP